MDVDTGKPSVYYYFSYAFLDQRPVVQVNDVVWFSDRQGKSPPWIEGGHLDGLTLRVTLDGRGRPVMVDGMNNCGCYHFFIPSIQGGLEPIAKPLSPDPFVPCFPWACGMWAP